MPQTMFLTDGAVDFSGGVDSGKVPLIQSTSNPNGVHRDQVCWATNATMRGGTISPRAGWKYLTTITDGTTLYQGGWMYEPGNANPYLILSIGGRILQVQCLAGFAPVDLSTAFALTNPATVDQAYFTQGEEFLVIQAGDAVTLPLFWDGTTLRRSHGLAPGPGLTPELPAAWAMDYYQGRIWYAQARTTQAGDIVGGVNGTVAYNFRDAILKVTENPLCAAGDGFSLPSHGGPIRALSHSSAIDKALGEGNLFIFTRNDVTLLDVPITRADWTSTTEPVQRMIQNKYGTPAERSVVRVNGDLFYVTMEPGTRSLALAVRYFNQWGNTPISRNMNRLIPFQDRSMLRFASGILFDNRLYHTCLPFLAGDMGVAFNALEVLDFDLTSSLQDKLNQNAVPAWEGISDGLAILQVFQGDFGGLDRAFAVVASNVDGTIQLWELTSGDKFENGDNRITWTAEFPAFDFQDSFQFKELQGGHLWMDRIYGKVDILVEYRSDDSACWTFWAKFDKCYARTSCEDLVSPICYPIQPYGEGAGKPLSLPHPDLKVCDSNGIRPMGLGYSFQVRVTIKGFARFRGLLLFASPRQQSVYANQVC